jgi:hypothetical protein
MLILEMQNIRKLETSLIQSITYLHISALRGHLFRFSTVKGTCFKIVVDLIKTRRCFIATAFQLCFRICHLEGPGKPGWSGIKWDALALVYADVVNLLGDNIDTIKKKKHKL